MNSKQHNKHTRSRGALKSVVGPAGIRDRVIGQYRANNKRAYETPDMKDRFPPHGLVVPLHPKEHKRPGLGFLVACVGCGRTKDLWEENNGEGLSKKGARYCCKPCSQGEPCICVDMDQRKGQELGSLWRMAAKPRPRHHNRNRRVR